MHIHIHIHIYIHKTRTRTCTQQHSSTRIHLLSTCFVSSLSRFSRSVMCCLVMCCSTSCIFAFEFPSYIKKIKCIAKKSKGIIGVQQLLPPFCVALMRKCLPPERACVNVHGVRVSVSMCVICCMCARVYI